MIPSTMTQDDIKTVLQNLDFQSNFYCSIVTIENIAANAEFSLGHNLGKTPSLRIIAKQTDGGYITDGQKPWDSSKIYLKNNGTAIRSLTVIILG